MLLGRYEVTECVRLRGQVAEFWATDPTHGHNVLLKTTAEAAPLEEIVREKFKREAIALRQFEHQGTMQLLDAGMHGERPVLVFDAPSGRLLSRALRDGATWSVPASLRMAHTLVETLALLHLRGWVHRDVRPSNVWLEPSDGNMRLTLGGFGLCGPPGSTALQGAVSHVAPELLRGGRATPTSDVYALGITLYEMFTGEPPLEARTPQAMLRAHLNHSPKPLDRVVPAFGEQCPGAVMLVHECIDRNPNIRPRDAADVLDRMGAFMDKFKVATTLQEVAPGLEEITAAGSTSQQWSRESNSDMFVQSSGEFAQFRTDEFRAKDIVRKVERMRESEEG